MLVLGMILYPLFSRNAPSLEKENSVVEKKSVMEIIFGAEFIACSLATCVTWGCAVIWLSNMANFVTAAKLDNGAEVRFAFNAMGFAGRLT